MGYFPTGPEVQDYIVAYSQEFRLRELIKWKSFVREVTPKGSGWEVIYDQAEGRMNLGVRLQSRHMKGLHPSLGQDGMSRSHAIAAFQEGDLRLSGGGHWHVRLAAASSGGPQFQELQGRDPTFLHLYGPQTSCRQLDPG